MAQIGDAISVEVNKKLAEHIARFRNDPLGFVMFAWPWGQPGKLANKTGPEPWQTELLTRLGEHCQVNADLREVGLDYEVWRSAVASGHGVGKAHSLDTVVPTPSGMRRWGDLSPGDFLFGEDGSSVEIKATRRFDSVPMRRVWFDDGSFCDVSSGHLWKVRGRQERRKGLEGWRVLSTAEIEAAGAQRRNGSKTAKQWEIPRQGAPDFDGSNVGIDPYVLGLWLGDGGRGSVRVTSIEPSTPELIRGRGYSVHVGAKVGTNAKSISVHGLAAPLRALGLFDKFAHEKRVPDAAMTQSADFRADVLRGLLDTDGEATSQSGCIVFSSTSEGLARDVIWLARSLGGKARMSSTVKKPFYRDRTGELIEGRPCWRATLRMPEGFRSFYSARKQDRVSPCEPRYLARWIAKIDVLPDAPAMCVEVAGGVYQANDFIVTHNSAIVAWLIYWLMSTRPDCRGVVTANTGAQLETKTWPELAKWHDMAINKHWFTWTASSFFFSQYPEEKRKNYMVNALTVSKDNTEAFAGLHNETSAVFIIKDEASGIDEEIYEVADGALTDGEPFSFDFGNPTQPTGPFFDAFGKYSGIYTFLKHVDSREVSHTNKNAIQNIIDKYGYESDQVKYRVRGMFPTRSYNGFITPDEVHAAQERKEYGDPDTALIMGIDVARYGDDDTVFFFRRGRDARSIPMLTFNGLDTTQVTEQVMIQIAKHKPDGIIVESIGPGVGVIDQLRARNVRVIEVHPGSSADKYQVFANKRAEWWSRMKDWLNHGCLPLDPEMESQLTEITYFLNKQTNLMQMESKADMKARGVSSPDKADALALTFATKVSPKERRVNGTFAGNQAITDYNVLDYGQPAF